MEAADQLMELLADPGSSIPLDRSLLLLAAARPGPLDSVEDGLRVLDDLAGGCSDHSIEGLTTHLFRVNEFRANNSDQHDPRNSLLDEVLRRGLGTPVTLAVIMIETGRRVGLALDGVGLPGQFLVRDRILPEIFLDPCEGGSQISEQQCTTRFRSIHGPDAAFDPRFLDPVDNRSIVSRVLNSLTASLRCSSPRDLDWILDLRVRLPAPPPDQRALAELCEARGRFEDAAVLLEQVALSTNSEVAAQRAFDLRARLN